MPAIPSTQINRRGTLMLLLLIVHTLNLAIIDRSHSACTNFSFYNRIKVIKNHIFF